MVPISVVFLFLCASSVLSALPEGWSACKKGSPNYEDCLKKEIKNAIQFLKNGNKKMGVIPLDPLHFESMDIEQGSGPVSITMNMKNLDVIGFSTSDVTSIKNDWKKMTITMHTAHVRSEGDYTIKGQILVLPISGTGRATIDWENMDVVFDITFKQITKDGKKIFQVDKMPVTLQPKKVHFNFENLFNGNKELGDNMNKFLNENWADIIKELKPALSKALEAGYGMYINRVLSKIPAEEIDVK